MNRKGFEKPIEIFVALFIIFAIALVLIKVFEGQIAQKDAQIARTQQERATSEQLQRVQLACADKCAEASNNGCNLQSLASLCAYSSYNILGEGTYIDLNGDGRMDYDQTLLAGVGVCEDRVYCFQTMDSCCSQRLSANDCKQILGKYWRQNALASSDADVQELLGSVAPAGTCSGPNLWSDLDAWG